MDNSSSSRIINFNGVNWLSRMLGDSKMSKTVTVKIIDVINTLIEKEQPAGNVISNACELLNIEVEIVAEEVDKAMRAKFAEMVQCDDVGNEFTHFSGQLLSYSEILEVAADMASSF